MAINLASRLSAIATDLANVNHIVWVEDNAIWHAQYDPNAGTWVNARPVVEEVTDAEGNFIPLNNVTALNLVANPQLIGISSATAAPGLAVIWQNGVVSSNGSNFYYSAAQHGPDGELQWNTPTAITVNETTGKLPFANLAPRAIADNTGQITIVGQQVNVLNVENQFIREDTDLYTSSLNIASFTPTTPIKPNAFYQPPVIVNGVNQGPGISINQSANTDQTPSQTSAVSSVSQMSGATTASAMASTTSASSNSAFQGVGFEFGPSISFDTDLIDAMGLDEYLFGIPKATVERGLKQYRLMGTLSGTTNFGSGLQLDSQGSAIRNNTTKWWEVAKSTGRPGLTDRKRTGFSVSLSYNSQATYQNGSPFNLLSINDSLSLTALDTVTIFNKPEGLIAGNIYLTGSFGIGANLILKPNTPGDSDSILQILLSDLATDLSSSLLTAVATNMLGGGDKELAATLIASGVFEPIENLLIGNLTDTSNLQVTSYLVGPTVGAQITGQFYTDLFPILKLNTSGGVTLFFTNEEAGTSGTTQLGIPISAGFSLGPLQANLSISPSWSWASNPSLPSSSSSPATAATIASSNAVSQTNGTTSTASTAPPTATVVGGLLTLTFNAPLDTSVIPDPSLFSVQVTPSNSSAAPVVAGVLVNNDSTTGNGVVVLQLSQPIAYSPQFTGTNPQPNGEASFTVSYTGSTLEYADKTSVDNFSDVSVTNNSLQTIAVVFNPTAGNSNDYTIGTTQTALLGYLDADYAQDSPPALTLVNQQVLAVWSREVQPLTPIAGFVNGSSAYLNFVQDLNTSSTPTDSQFTVTVNGVAGTVSNVSINGGYVFLNLNQTVVSTDTVSVSYKPNPTSQTDNLYLTDAVNSTLWIPAFSENLTNTTGQSSTAAPTILGGAVVIENGGANNLITLIFSGRLASNTPNGTQFTVTSNGQSYDSGSIGNVTVTGNFVTFSLPAPSSTTPLISQGDIVSVTYTPSGEDTDLTEYETTNVVGGFTIQPTTLPENPTTTLMAGLYSPGSAISKLQNIPGSDGLNFDPAVASDTNGNALAVWVYADSSDIDNLSNPGQFYTDNESQAILDNLNQSDIYFSYWDGSQWTIADSLATNQSGTDRNVTVAYDSSSHQYIAAWLNNNNGIQFLNPEVESSAAPALINNNGTFYLAYVEQGGSQIFLTTSSDAGQTWTSAVQLPNTITTSQSPALAFYQGALYLAYVGTNNWGSPVLNITSSADNGQTWSSPYSPDDQSISSAGVSLVVYQGQLMAFFVQPDEDSVIAYVYSSNPQSSNSWSTAYNIMPNQSAGSAVSATVMDETLYLAYRGVDSPVNYYITNTNSSTLSSLNWSTSELSGATSPNTAPGITNDGSQLYFTYGDSNGNLNYLTSSDGSSWSELNEINNQISNDTPSPAILNGALYLGFTSAANENIYVITEVADETTIYWASYNPTGGWSSVSQVLSEANPDPLTDLVLSSVNSKPALFWTQTQPVSYSQITEEENPVVYLRLGELSGTTANNSGNLGYTANGTYNGSFTLGEDGALYNSTAKSGDPNPAALFVNGGGVTLNSAVNTNSSAFSVEFWFNIPNAVTATTNLVDLAGVFNVSLNSGGTLTFALDNSDGSYITTSASANPLVAGTWNYVVGTYSNQTQALSLYLNGQPVQTINDVSFTLPANAALTLAGGTDAVYLDEVALYGSALSYSAPPTTQTVNSLDVLNSIFGTDQIGVKYAAQYVAPLPPGPQTQVSILDSSSTSSPWNAQSLINPFPFLQPTTLSDANTPIADIVSSTTANPNGSVYPNRLADTVYQISLTGVQTQTISGISVEVNGTTYVVGSSYDSSGTGTSLSGNQLGVVVGDSLINTLDSQSTDTSFSYVVLGQSVTINLLIDAGSGISEDTAGITVYYAPPKENTAPPASSTFENITPSAANSSSQTPGNVTVLGTATVTENEDSSLTLIDSGFVVNTTNPGMGYVVASADFNNDGKSDVAVGNRGYTDSSGDILNNGTVQILMGGQAVLGGNSSVQLSSPTRADASAGASGNTGGFSIIGIPDVGQANGDSPLSMATSDVNGDGYDDLVIGSPNNNTVYVIYGSYLASASPETVIDVANLTSAQGYAITSPNGATSSDNFGFAVAVGNFDGSGEADVAIGAPNANNGQGEVYVAYNGSSQVQSVYEGIGYLVTMTLDFGTTLDSTAVPTATQFIVTSNSQSLTVRSVSVSGSTVVLVAGASVLSAPLKLSVTYQQNDGSNSNLTTASGTVVQNFTSDSTNDSPSVDNPSLATTSQETMSEQAGYALATSSYIKSTSTSPAGPATFSGSTSTDDLIVGAPNFALAVNNSWSGIDGLPFNSPNPYPASTPVNVGAVYVFESSASSSSSSSSGLNSTASFIYYGTDATTPSANGAAQPLFAGSALASNGDWDGDGRLDLAIAAPADNENSGAVYILSGALAGTPSNPQYLNAVSNLTLNGGLPLGQVGAVVTSAGDLNDDRYDDLLVTAPQGANAVGQGYVVFGETALFEGKVGDSFRNLSPVATDTKTTFLLNGNFPYQLTGQAAAAIGDINHDGVDDLMITAPNANQLYAVYGHPWLADDGSIKLADISGDNGFVTDGDLYTVPVPTQIYDIGGVASSLAPSLISNNGTFYLAYVDAANHQIILVTSSDGGQTWSNAIQLPSDITTSHSPSLAIYGGTLYLAYVGANNQINLTSSTNNGQSWSSPYAIDQFSSAGVSLVVYQGELFAFFVANNPASDILYIYSDNPQSSNSWSTDYQVVDGGFSETSTSAVSATVMGDTLYIAYLFEGNFSSYSYFVASTSGSDLSNLVWSAYDPGAPAYNSAPSITNDGSQLYFIYSNNSQELTYATSGDGLSWSAFNAIPGQTSNQQPASATLSGRLYLGYLGDAEIADIYFTALSFNQPLVGTGNNVVMLGDVNGDGFADILAGGSPYGAILTFGASIQDLLDSATGSDESIVTVAGGSIQKVLAAGDFNGDGLADFGVVDLNNNFYLFFGDTQLGPQKILSLSTGTNTSLGNISSAAAAGDYDGDGYDDLLLTLTAPNDQQPTTYIYKGNSRGALNSSEVFTNNNNTVFNAIGDVNGDGFGDIGGGAPTSNQVSPFSAIANGGGTVYIGNSAANSDAGNSLNPPAASIIAPLQTDSSYWYTNNFSTQQSTKYNGAPSFAVYNEYLYMGYTGVTDSSANGSPFVQRSADGVNWGDSLTNFSDTIGQASSGFTLATFKDKLYAAYLTPTSSPKLIITYAVPSSTNNLGLEFNSNQNYNTGQDVSFVSPAMAVFENNLYVFYATGNQNSSQFGYFYSSDGNTWTQVTSISLPNGSSLPDGYLPLGASFAVTTASFFNETTQEEDNYLYLTYATSQGSGGGSDSLTFATFDGNNWTTSAISQAPLRGSGLLFAGEFYNFYLPDSTTVDVISSSSTPTPPDNGWGSPAGVEALSQVSGGSGTYPNWLTYPNPILFQEKIYIGYGIQYGTKGESTLTNAFVAYGSSNQVYQPNQTQQFGQQLESIGDFNGDGIGDFAVLAPGFFSNFGITNNNTLENNQGAVLIYYGSTNGFDSGSSPNPDVVLATPAPTASTNVANNQALLLTQFAPTGDINGDGYDDLIIASPNTALENNSNTTDGLALVVFGGGESLWGNTYPATSPFNLGNLTSYTSQLTLSFSNPLNTDSLPAANTFTVQSDLNSIAVTSISATSNELTLTLASDADTSAVLIVSYTQPTSSSETALSYLSGKNVANFTASNDAAVASLGAPTIDITPNDPRYGFLITGLPEAQSGISLAGGGDVNGDGFSDFLIGAPGNDDNLAYTLFGSDFNNTVNQTGTIGDDVMVGSPTGESFVAGQGNDVIATGGGVDVVYAGPGNDQVIVNDVYFQRLDGGPGLDALFFQGYYGQDWDLTTLSPGLRLRNFEFLVTEDYGANTLTLNAVTVTQISPTNTLSLILDGTDSVVLSSDFSYQGTVYQSNRNFQEYTSSSSAARVLINQPNVSVSSSAPSTNTPAPILPTETNTTVVSPALAGANLATSVSEVSATADSDESADFVSTAVILDPGNTVPTQIYVSNPTVSERAGRAEFTITRTGDLNQYVWVDYYTQDGDAKAGERYTPVAGQLVFSPGESTAAVTVPIPNNRKYVGKRQFELVVNLEGESIDPSAVPDQWQTAIAAPSEQIRRWNMVPGDNNNNSITLDVTSTKSPNNVATLDLDLKGTVIPQVWNFSTRSYQNIPFNPTNGIVQVQDRNNDLINDLYRLRLQDGGPFDGDGLVNGLIDLNFEIAQLKSVDVPAGGGRVEGTESNNYINAQNSTGTNRLEGQGGMDVLIGSAQRDVLLGGEGNDLLMGGANIDQLYGGAGDDLLDGGLGTNFLYGDVGADSFLLRRGDGPHRVMDFNPAEGDFFLLENLSMSQLGFSGNQIKLGTNTLAIVIDSFGKPVANFAANPSWFSTVLS